MVASSRSGETWTYRAREAVGVFINADALEDAVNRLEVSGFDRADISVLAADDKVKDRIGRLYRSVREVVDDGRAPLSAFESRDSLREGEAATVAVPIYVGGLAGIIAVVASGGALASVIAAALIGSATGGGVGGLVAHAVARHHADRVTEQLAKGGLVLWVNVPDAYAERRALDILEGAGAGNVHVHTLERTWGPKDRPLSETQLDPFLEGDTPR